MSIAEQIEQDFQQAYKNKDESVVSVLRMIKAALKNAKIQKIADLTEDDVTKILRTEVKKRKESITEYEQAGRQELAAKEASEIQIVEKYLPAQLGEEKIREVVKTVLSQNQDVNAGKIMGAVMAQLKGQADGNLVKKIVEEELAGTVG